MSHKELLERAGNYYGYPHVIMASNVYVFCLYLDRRHLLAPLCRQTFRSNQDEPPNTIRR